MTDRPFTTPEYPSFDSDAQASEPHVESQSTSTFAEAQVAASPADRGWHDSSASSPSSASTADTARETAATARHEARTVAADAKESGRHVAETAKLEARDVAAETQQQARHLYRQLRTEVTDQAATQHQRAATGLRSLADELGQMVGTSQQPGLATDVARQASDRARGFADWLEEREPGDILNEARDFARRRPGTFLMAAAAVGFLGGRMTRGLADDDGDRTDTPTTTATNGHRAPAPSFASTTPTYGGDPYAVEADERYGATSAAAADPARVGAGIDPASYTHPDPERSPVDRAHGIPSGDGYGEETR